RDLAGLRHRQAGRHHRRLLACHAAERGALAAAGGLGRRSGGRGGRRGRGGVRPPVGWAPVAGAGTIAGAGFTVALLVATLACDGTRLEEAKVGILSAVLGAPLLTRLLFKATARLPRRLRILAVLGTAQTPVDSDP